MPFAPKLRRAALAGAAITALTAATPHAAAADDALPVTCDPATSADCQALPTVPVPVVAPPAPAPTPPAPVPATPKPATPHAPCADANLMPSAANIALIRHATLCLLNLQRRLRHRHALRSNTTLQGVAERYTHLMVSEQFFDHVSPSGSTFIDRIRRTSYLSRAASWSLGENLAWGSGFYATPKQTVIAWMHSPGHRHNILEPRYREIGIGIAVGTPTDDGGVPGATYATEFGKRTR